MIIKGVEFPEQLILDQRAGSLAFVAAARAAFLIALDKRDKHRRLFLPIKNNSGDNESGLAFIVQSVIRWCSRRTLSPLLHDPNRMV